MANGEYAIGYFNLSDNRADALLYFHDIGIPVSSGYGLELYDCLSHKKLDGVYKNYYNTILEPHGCAVFKAKMVKI